MYSYIGKPRSAYCTAGASTSPSVFVPWVSSTVRYASTAPGTVNERCASGPGPVGMRSRPRVAKEGDRREGRRDALAAHGEGVPASRVVDERHALAAQRVGRGRLHHGGGKAGGHGRRRRRCRPRAACACRPSTRADGPPRRRPACPRPRVAWSPGPLRDARSRESAQSVWSWTLALPRGSCHTGCDPSKRAASTIGRRRCRSAARGHRTSPTVSSGRAPAVELDDGGLARAII